MIQLKTYRSRLIFYVALLAAFLVFTLLVSSYYARDILLEEAESNTRRTAKLLDTHIRSHYNDIIRYGDIVTNDTQLQEYMFVVVSLGADGEPLQKLYNRQFNWLPVSESALIDVNGNLVIGTEPSKPALTSRNINLSDTKKPEAVYYYDAQGLRLVSTTPINYREEELGKLILTLRYNEEALKNLEIQSNGKLLITKNNTFIFSSDHNILGQNFDRYKGRFKLGEESYLMHRISLPGIIATPGLELWFATSETALFESISRFNQITLVIVVISVLGIVLLGNYLLRNLQQPLKELADMTHDVAQGDLPQFKRHVETNEIDSLSNKFMDMVQSLREKQNIIDETQRQLESLAVTDTLTGLYNRRHLLELFPKLHGQAQRNNERLGAILVDIDHFKHINDSHGHLAGDQCLREFSAVLRATTRKNDFLFRMGGEEFLILTLGENIEGIRAHAEKIRLAVQQRNIQYDNLEILMTVSCGISLIDVGDAAIENVMNTLLKQADNALYQAKNKGRNRTVIFDGELDPSQGESLSGKIV